MPKKTKNYHIWGNLIPPSILKTLPVTNVFVANPHIASANSLDYPSLPKELALLRLSISFYDIASPIGVANIPGAIVTTPKFETSPKLISDWSLGI